MKITHTTIIDLTERREKGFYSLRPITPAELIRKLTLVPNQDASIIIDPARLSCLCITWETEVPQS